MRHRLFVQYSVLALAFLQPSDTWANQCDQLRLLAQQNANLYSSSRDAAHRAAAQNYQNAYAACVNNLRQAARPAPGGTGALPNFGTLPGTWGSFSTYGTGRSNTGPDPADTYNREQALREQARREQEQREREEQERQAAERAEQERQAELEADRRARCAARNSFGNASGCGPQGAGATSPFGAKAGGGTFASQQGRTPDPTAYDSVKKRDCQDGVSRGCISDDWRKALAMLSERGVQVPAGYKPSDYSRDVISSEQYERIGRGQATFEQIEDENFDAWTKRLQADIERQYQQILKEVDAQ